MFLNSLVAGIANAIGSQVIGYLKNHQEKVQFESMQGEILEGWMYKVRIAIRDTHRKEGVSLESHRAVMKAVEEVVKKEFDTRKL